MSEGLERVPRVGEQLLALGASRHVAVEIDDRVRVGGPVVHQPPVEHVEDVVHQPVRLERGLVDREQHGAPFVGEAAQEAHDVDGVFARQAGRGLVQHEQRGLGDQLLREVDALSLPAADPLFDRVADARVAGVGDLKLIEQPLDLGVDLLARGVRWQAQPRGVVERLSDRELREDDVVLRDVADGAAVRVVVRVEVVAIDQAAPGAWQQVAVEGHHERRLPRTRGAHQADELGGVSGEAHVVDDLRDPPS